MKQNEFAKTLGLSQTTYSIYETGRSLCSTKILIKVSELYGLELSDITKVKKKPTKEDDAIAIIGLIKRGVIVGETFPEYFNDDDIKRYAESAVKLLTIEDERLKAELFDILVEVVKKETMENGGKNDE
jgi:DNA-binding XRE family transcriptional regulator